MIRLRRQRPFLEVTFKGANRNRRQETLKHANADQINAVSEMDLNLLRNRTSFIRSPWLNYIAIRQRYERWGKGTNSVKRLREHLREQKDSGFWQGLSDVFQAYQCLTPEMPTVIHCKVMTSSPSPKIPWANWSSYYNKLKKDKMPWKVLWNIGIELTTFSFKIIRHLTPKTCTKGARLSQIPHHPEIPLLCVRFAVEIKTQ